MKRPVVFLFIALCAVSALSLAEDKESKPPVSMSPAGQFDISVTTPTPKPTTTTTTTAKPTTTTTTTKPTTTKPTTTTTTAKPTTTTTTAKPTTTTTAKPTTTTTTTKPTTTTPTTTTTTTTTAPPPPKPTPSTTLTAGNYTLMTDKQQICVMAQVALQIRLGNGTFIVQPNLTKADGGCQETKANLTLVFKEGFITFMFNKSTADDMVYVNALSFGLSYPLSKGGNSQYSANNNSVHLFNAKVGHSYSCKSESLYMGNGLYLDVSQDRMQAFNLTKSNDFGLPDRCAADQPDYRVAIAVGVTLLVLIIIVVVAYLLGRRKRTDGYQTL